jgi:DnaJ-like protein
MSADREDRRRAYAVLGLAPGAPPDEVRRRYKSLVKRWHPDRHMADPRGASEAAERLREINAAYARLRHAYRAPAPAHGAAGPGSAPPSAPPHSAARPKRRLTREEIERMVQSIGTAGPFEIAFGEVRWVGRLFDRLWIPCYAAAAVVIVVRVVIFGDLHPETILFVVLLVGFGFTSWLQHRFGSKPSRTAGTANTATNPRR